ncbi:uncharacterized protein V6R79_016693 [Siganus canaliculatus]
MDDGWTDSGLVGGWSQGIRNYYDVVVPGKTQDSDDIVNAALIGVQHRGEWRNLEGEKITIDSSTPSVTVSTMKVEEITSDRDKRHKWVFIISVMCFTTGPELKAEWLECAV